MLHILTSKANRDNDDIAEFGRRWDDEYYYPTNSGGFCGAWHSDGGLERDCGGVNPGKSISVSFKPMVGVLMQIYIYH